MAETTAEARENEMAVDRRGRHRGALRRAQAPMVPPVDVYENDQGIIVLADMPGVPKDGLDIQVDKNVLTIKGKITGVASEEIKPLYAEFNGTGYQRQFTLGRDVDIDHINAKISAGVLRLFLPRVEAVKPRRIEVKAV
jgi:HSP20 family protein